MLRRLTRLVLYPLVGLAIILMLRYDAHLILGNAPWVDNLVFGLGMLAGPACIFEAIFPAPPVQPEPQRSRLPRRARLPLARRLTGPASGG